MTSRFFTLVAVDAENGAVELRSTTVGFVRGLPEVGAIVGEGLTIGAIETLGDIVPIVVPTGATGRVVARLVPAIARAPVGHGTPLLTIDRSATTLASSREADAKSEASGLVFASPMSGRFYLRPSPTKPALVEAGAEVTTGQAICLIEVMKTFNRVAYGGAGLPPRVRIARALVEDGADVVSGQPLFALESVD